jgi:hypothetical protein
MTWDARQKYVAKSHTYKGVYSYHLWRGGIDVGIQWRAEIGKGLKHKKKWASMFYATEREAALAYDKRLIELKLPPIHILKQRI